MTEGVDSVPGDEIIQVLESINVEDNPRVKDGRSALNEAVRRHARVLMERSPKVFFLILRDGDVSIESRALKVTVPISKQLAEIRELEGFMEIGGGKTLDDQVESLRKADL